MLDKVIKALEQERWTGSDKAYLAEVIAEATEMYNRGWAALEDGSVINYKGNYVACKKGDTVETYEMGSTKGFRIENGVLTGDIKSTIKTTVVTEDKKESYLAQAVVAKHYTRRTA